MCKYPHIHHLLISSTFVHNDNIYNVKSVRHYLLHEHRRLIIEISFDRNDMVRFDSLSADSKVHVGNALTVKVSICSTVLHFTELYCTALLSSIKCVLSTTSTGPSLSHSYGDDNPCPCLIRPLFDSVSFFSARPFIDPIFHIIHLSLHFLFTFYSDLLSCRNFFH